MMLLGYHGGKCCGIKTIFNLGNNPTAKVQNLPRIGLTDKDACGDDVSSNDSFFHEEAPVETYEQRLDRYLEYLSKRRPKGIVEVVLTDYYASWQEYSQHEWVPVLESRGFELVTEARNSNSGNNIYVYHLVMDYDIDEDYDEDEDEYDDPWDFEEEE